MKNNIKKTILGMFLFFPKLIFATEYVEYIDSDISITGWLPVFFLLLPLLGIIINSILGKDKEIVKDAIAVIFTLTTLFCSFYTMNYIFNPVEIDGRLYQGIIHSFKYMPNFNIYFRIDKMSMVLFIVAGFFWVISSIYVLIKNKKDSKYKGYGLFILIALFLNHGIFLAGDFLTLFVFYEGMAVFPYFALLHYKSDIVAHEEKKFLLSEVVTGISLLLGIILFWFFTKTLEMKDFVLFFATQVPPLWSSIILVLVVFGFGGKSIMFFQHVFPSKTKTNVLIPIPGSFIFSAILLQICIYGILRYMTVALYKI